MTALRRTRACAAQCLMWVGHLAALLYALQFILFGYLAGYQYAYSNWTHSTLLCGAVGVIGVTGFPIVILLYWFGLMEMEVTFRDPLGVLPISQLWHFGLGIVGGLLANALGNALMPADGSDLVVPTARSASPPALGDPPVAGA